MMSALLRFVGIRPTVAPTFARESLPATQRATRWALQRAPRGPVLMLDIDGVLHPGQSGTLIYLPLLETWLRAHPDVDVVISSNWRETHTLDELRNDLMQHIHLENNVLFANALHAPALSPV